jgi:hypothetical protein
VHERESLRKQEPLQTQPRDRQSYPARLPVLQCESRIGSTDKDQDVSRAGKGMNSEGRQPAKPKRSMSVMAIFRQLSTERNVCDVNEQGCTPNSSPPDNQSQQRQRHSIRMPTALFPSTCKIVHCASQFVGSPNGEHSKSEKERRHDQCCGCIGTTWVCSLHTYKIPQGWPKGCECNGDFSPITAK